jgi:hypothetical protein
VSKTEQIVASVGAILLERDMDAWSGITLDRIEIGHIPLSL